MESEPRLSVTIHVRWWLPLALRLCLWHHWLGGDTPRTQRMVDWCGAHGFKATT